MSRLLRGSSARARRVLEWNGPFGVVHVHCRAEGREPLLIQLPVDRFDDVRRIHVAQGSVKYIATHHEVIGLDPFSWTPDQLGERSSRC